MSPKLKGRDTTVEASHVMAGPAFYRTAFPSIVYRDLWHSNTIVKALDQVRIGQKASSK